MCDYIKSDYELSSAEDEIGRDFTLVTKTANCSILDFRYQDYTVYELNTKLTNYNDSIVDDFWSFYYDEMRTYLDEINEKEYFSIIHYKGKRFYIVDNLVEIEKSSYSEYFTYKNYDNKEKRDVLKKLISVLESNLIECEIKGFINNELEIGGYSTCSYKTEYYNNGLFNLDLLNKLFDDDLFEASFNILEFIDWKKVTLDFATSYNSKELSKIVSTAYKNMMKKIRVNKTDKLRKFNNLLDYNMAIA